MSISDHLHIVYMQRLQWKRFCFAVVLPHVAKKCSRLQSSLTLHPVLSWVTALLNCLWPSLSPSSCLVSPLRRLRLRLYFCVWDRGRAENLFAWLQSSPYYWMCSIEHLSVYKMLMMVSDKWLSIFSFLGSLYISYPLERQYNKSFKQGHCASSAKLSILSNLHDRFVAFSC